MAQTELIKPSLHTRGINCRSNYDQHLELKTYGIYSRQELFDLVWSEPMSKLAPLFGVSTTLISDACKEHHIPKPPRGYWSKVRAGRKLSKPQLHTRPLGMSNIVRLGRPRRIEPTPQTYIREDLADVRKRVAATINQQNHHGTEPIAHRKRSERIWHLLTAALVSFEGKVLVEPGQPSKAIVKVYHQRVAIWIVDTEATACAAKEIGAIKFRPLQVFMADRTYSDSAYRIWQDEDGAPIEAKMSEIAAEVIVHAELQQRRAEARVVERRSLDHQHNHPDTIEENNSEEPTVRSRRDAIKTALLKQAMDYERSKSLLGLLEAVQSAFPTDANSNIKNWCDLVSAEIQAIDPITNKRFLRVLDIDVDSEPRIDQAA